ncbi:MAG TPA: acyltransferase, partial [Candidatus Acidoferrum sp.]|nr:acyltransferase [Candidatus Acidoferrum sp.]
VWASWTIGVEMIFYAIFPFLFARLRSIPALTAAFFSALLFAVAFHEFLLHTALPENVREGYFSLSLPRVLPIFLFGMLGYRLYREKISAGQWPPSMGYALVALSLYAYHALLFRGLNFGFTDVYYWEGIIYGILLFGLAIYPLRLFVNRATQYLGRISYSIYLLHPSIVLFLEPVYTRIYAQPFPLSVQFLLSAVITLATTSAAASLTYLLIEKPGMNLGKKILQSKLLTTW